MIKRAVVAGLNATGCHVRDLRVASPAVTRFTTRDTRCEGGVHVCSSAKDPQTVEIHFYDKRGIDIAAWQEKKVERLYFRQEFRRAFFEDIGEILYPPRALEYYTAGLLEALGGQPIVQHRTTIVVDMGHSPASFVLSQAAMGWNVELVALRPFVDSERTRTVPEERDTQLRALASAVRSFDAALGVSIDGTAERVTLVTGSGRVLDQNTALHAMACLWCKTDQTGRGLAVPVSASRVIEEICGADRSLKRVGTTRRALATAALDPHIGFAGSQTGGFVFPDFLASYDAVMTIGMLLKMLEEREATLDDVVENLPEFYLRSASVPCPFTRKGAVMRVMAEMAHEHESEMSEGVRIIEDSGWALVLPHPSEACVDVHAEGSSAKDADGRLRRYISIVEQAIREAQ